MKKLYINFQKFVQIVIGGDGSLTGANIFRQEWKDFVQELLEEGKCLNQYSKISVQSFQNKFNTLNSPDSGFTSVFSTKLEVECGMTIFPWKRQKLAHF